MKLGADISQIVYDGTGVGRFVKGLSNFIIDNDRNNEWTFFFSSLRQELKPELRERIIRSGHRLVEYRLPPTVLSFLWNTLHRLKVEKLTGKLDWFLTSDWTEGPSRMRKATVIHDLVYLRHPQTVHPLIRKTQKERMRWVVKESKVIFADSLSTKNDIIELLGVPEGRIYVNYPGVDTIDADRDSDSVLRKFLLKRPFILTVGKIEPRKNIGRLMEAFGNLGRSDIDLVVVGAQGWDKETSKEQSEKNNIRFLNYVTDRELATLYNACLFFAYPSLYEGFGYPLVEAMRAGAPAASSHISSMKEIGQGCVRFFNPLDTSSITEALDVMISNPKLRDTLKKEGIMKSRRYEWKAYWDELVSVLEDNLSVSGLKP